MKTESAKASNAGSIAGILWCCFLAFALMGAPLGCASMSGPPTLKQTDVQMSWKMTHFRNASEAGRYSLGEREQGNAACASYQAAFAKALEAAHGDRNAPTPDDLLAVANQTIRVLSSLP